MNLLKKILIKLNGLHYPQEYLCFARELFQQPLHAYFISENRIIKDITNEHLLTGYCPMILTLLSTPGHDLPDNIEIIFSQRFLHPNESPRKKEVIARLELKKIHRQLAGNTSIHYFEGTKGEHHFLSSFHQYIIGLYNRLYNKKQGNVFLHDNLYKQVQIGYSIPRTISLVTVSDGNTYNLFPTDLHGAINENYYVGSLRHEGKACRQVENSRCIVISQVHCDSYKTVYSLGRNHMKELRPIADFPFDKTMSSVFQLPLPKSVLYYRELELVESFIHEIHKIMLYKIISQHAVNDDPATLAHVHNCYATWRYKHKISSNFLLR